MIAAASAVAVAATPHFFSLYPYPFQTQGSEAQQRLIVEWSSPDFHDVELRPFEAMIFLVVIGFALKRPSLYESCSRSSGSAWPCSRSATSRSSSRSRRRS